MERKAIGPAAMLAFGVLATACWGTLAGSANAETFPENPVGCPGFEEDTSTTDGILFPSAHRFVERKQVKILKTPPHWARPIRWPTSEQGTWETHCSALIYRGAQPSNETCTANDELIGTGALLAIRRSPGLDGFYEGVMTARDRTYRYRLSLVPHRETVEGIVYDKWLVGTSPDLEDHTFYVVLENMRNGKKFFVVEIFDNDDLSCWTNRPRDALVCANPNPTGESTDGSAPSDDCIGTVRQTGTGGGYEPPSEKIDEP